MTRSRAFLLAHAAAALTMTCGAPVWAQTTQAGPPEFQDPRQEPGDASTGELEQVVVTAERRVQNLQDYAGVAQAFSDQDLQILGVTDIENLDVLIPGMNVANQEGNVEIYIRGVGTSNNTELGDPSAATHLNGVYLPRPRGLQGFFFDLARVEVAKGPQGTLRGRNAVAGTLNIVTRAPEIGKLGGYAQVEAGSDAMIGYEAALNVPISSLSAARLAIYSSSRESSYENVGLDQSLRPAGEEQQKSIRLSYLFEPSERLRIMLIGDYEKEDGTGYPGTNIRGALVGGKTPDEFELRENLYRGVQGDVDTEQWGFALQASYDFGPAVLEYNGSRRSLDFFQVNASNEGVVTPTFDADDVNYDSFSTVYWLTRSLSTVHELRLASPAQSRIIWSGGVFYFQEEQQVGFLSVADFGLFYSGTEFTFPDVDGKSLAAYADITFPVTDQLRLKAGYRHTDEEKSRTGIGGNYTLGLGSAGFGCCFVTRLGTEGFMPNFLGRTNFTAPTTPAQTATYFQTAFTPGRRDTLLQQIAGVADGTRPNGTCVNRPDTQPSYGGQVCPANGQHSFFTLAGPAAQQGSYEDSFQDYRVGFEYDLSERNLVYGQVATGHKSGGFNDTIVINNVPQSPIFDPESLTMYELGTKNTLDWMGRGLNLNANVFYYSYKDQVFPTLVQLGGSGTASGFSQQNVNVGDSTILGAEVEARFQLPADMRLDLVGAYIDAEFEEGALFDTRAQTFGADTPNFKVDVSGNELPNVSRWNLNAHLQQRRPLFGGEADWHILANYRSAYYLNVYNEDPVLNGAPPALIGQTVNPDSPPAGVTSVSARQAGFWARQEGFVTVNLGVGWEPADGRFRLEAFANNIFDETAVQKQLVANTNVNLFFLNQPRNFGARLRVDF